MWRTALEADGAAAGRPGCALGIGELRTSLFTGAGVLPAAAAGRWLGALNLDMRHSFEADSRLHPRVIRDAQARNIALRPQRDGLQLTEHGKTRKIHERIDGSRRHA